jgi:hypothetical protein
MLDSSGGSSYSSSVYSSTPGGSLPAATSAATAAAVAAAQQSPRRRSTIAATLKVCTLLCTQQQENSCASTAIDQFYARIVAEVCLLCSAYACCMSCASSCGALFVGCRRSYLRRKFRLLATAITLACAHLHTTGHMLYTSILPLLNTDHALLLCAGLY